MRLLYWFTRFLDGNGNNTQPYHGLREFELNLSTHMEYHYNPETHLFSEKPYSAPLPDRFWGDPLLYNLNVIVGNNGAGKTTVIHTIMNTLQELYHRKIDSRNESVLLLEGKKTVLLHLTGTLPNPARIQTRFSQLRFAPGEITANENVLDEIDCTKIIYITNTLSELDDERAKNADKRSHARDCFIYDCSLSGTIRHNANDDCYQQADLMHAYFVNEYYKQVKLVCDQTQHAHLSVLRESGLPVPVPEKLTITIRDTRKSYAKLFDLKRCVAAQPSLSDKIAYRLCMSCYFAFLDNLRSRNVIPKKNAAAPENASADEFQKLFDTVNSDGSAEFTRLYNRCICFIHFVCNSKKQFSCFFTPPTDLDAMQNGSSVSMTLSIDDFSSPWLIAFMERYRLTCAPYYYLDFSWGLSSGENNLLRLFSSLVCRAWHDSRG